MTFLILASDNAGAESVAFCGATTFVIATPQATLVIIDKLHSFE
jgi:hypothetical protein